MAQYMTEGIHILCDAFGVDKGILDDLDFLEMTMVQGVEKCGATVKGIQHQKFEPNGVTILLLLSESHFSIHTYPEHQFASIDCYTCGQHADPEIAVKHLLEKLKPETHKAISVKRGLK